MFKSKIYIIFFLLTNNFCYALTDNLTNENETIFSWAEHQYPQFFSPAIQATQTIGIWNYRYYPGTGIYIGINDNRQVYVMGGGFGDTPILVGSTSDVLLQVVSSSKMLTEASGACFSHKIPPVGMVAINKYTREEQTNSISTILYTTETTLEVRNTLKTKRKVFRESSKW